MKDLGPAVFLGFTAKRKRPRTSWLPESVEEICSATSCQAETPEEGLKKCPEWYRCGLVASEEAVRQAIEAEPGDPDFDIYAYRSFALWFSKDGAHRGLHPAMVQCVDSSAPNLDDYDPLGYDVLQVQSEPCVWGCSPLSCNGMAREAAVNRFCLLDRLDEAVEVGYEFGLQPPEPGEYVLVEVLRRRR